jgi:hypothetical protein
MSLPGLDQLLASLSSSAVFMASDKDQFGSYCWGFTNGIFATLECLNIDQGVVSPKVLTGSEEEVDKKCYAGAASLLDSFRETFEKMAILEETQPGIVEKKAAFLENVKKRYNQFLKDTVKEN